MSDYNKLSRPTGARIAMLRTLTTHLLYYGKIKTTLARAKEVRRKAERLITLAVKERDNYEETTVVAKVARKEKLSPKDIEKGKNATATGGHRRVKEMRDGKKVTVYDEVNKTIKKDLPSRLAARRKIYSALHPVTKIPPKNEIAGRRANTVKIDMAKKLFEEIAPKYADRNGGYTRIIKIGQRKGDGALEVLIELV
jgi:large subunit ribosomal protein L17